jgi:hypothetical protein
MIKNYKPELNTAYVDKFYDFKGNWDVPSRCGLKIARNSDWDIVIATELYLENPGTSVTEFCPKLATLIVIEFELDPDKLCFIVRTPENNSKLSFLNEFFSKANMAWIGNCFSSPQWEPLTKERVDALLKT